MTELTKLPPKGLIDVEFFNSYVVITLKREDGKELGITLTKQELINFVEYLTAVLKVIK